MNEQDSFSYNEAMKEVEAILEALEKNEADIDEMSRLVKRAIELLQACKKKLYETDEEVKQLFEQLKTT
jgi:exodeoxyribonuclease VII small subunit